MATNLLKAYCNLAVAITMLVNALYLPDCNAAQQNQDNSCINQLIPCLTYLNGTRDPPDSCCNPLKSVIKSSPECLCSLISNKGSRQAEQAGINVNEAQQLPGRCGQHVNPISCLVAPSGGGSSNSKNSVQNSASGLSFWDVSGGMVTVMAVVSSGIVQALLMSS